MRVLFVVNPKSGRGKAGAVLPPLEEAVRSLGHDIQRHDLQADSDDVLQARLAESSLAVVIGGDGTVRAVAQHARDAQVDLYHAAVGTENLFSREFGMNPKPATLVRAITNGTRHTIDVGGCNDRRFMIMVSVGLDASVIRRLDARRTGAISHLSYLQPILAELRQPHVPVLTVEADGRPVVEAQSGTLVIANSRQYAMRVDPVPGADMTDGLLDMVFMPHRGPVGLAMWGARARLRHHLRDRRVVQHRAASFVVRTEGETIYQLDGEAGAHGMREISVALAPEKITVLAP